MAVPDLRAIVQRVYARGGFDLTTKAGCGRFTEVCAVELHQANANFGHLRKSAGRNHVVDTKGNRHAVDAVLYKPTGQSVDIIGSSESPKAKPAWTVDIPRYKASDWYAPEMPDVGPTEPDPGTHDPEVGTRWAEMERRIAAIESWARSFPK